ncbi:unnamed protein product [Macrosiphum euphorbiae]|uniref:Uncharacterized protein n=1 Tax=Macrosiphum euphorbiae TaxID=13131 RepID=A0AAV0WYU6_9HEMI|nr:unnamed protein product [Macrosiphum euphorbiae]
MDLLNKNIFV